MPSGIEILVVGRTHSGSRLDIEIPAVHDTVGRKHAEITLGAGGECHIVDLGSANGTHVLQNKKWVRVQQKAIFSDDQIRLGDFETSVTELLKFRRRRDVPPPIPKSHTPSKPRRNPATGEIE
jgi:pSer/pThr/pTyr-binding forkhead associated (FHA) protein